MAYTQAKECINELGREGLEKLLKDYGKEVIKTAFGCGISPRELQAVCRWLERGYIKGEESGTYRRP